MSGCEAKVPALRFKVTPAENAEGGLLPSNTGGRARTPTAPWKRNRFGEIATRKSTMGNAVALPRVEYEDVIPFSGFFNNDIFAKPSDKIGVQFSEGDVLFGKLRPYLGNWILAEFKGLAVGDWWVLRPKGIDSEFLYTLIQSPSFQDVANQSSGSKMPRADWSLVSETFFSCPNDPVEQRRIGSFFRSLDALIAGREKALEKLEALKKSMLLKMFPQGDATVPEVRFKGFAGDWEKKRLGDMCRICTGKKDVNEGSENGQYPFFTCSREVLKSRSFSFDGEAILIAGNGEVGNLHYINGKFEAYQRTYVLMKFQCNPSFLFQHFSWNLMSSLSHGTIGSSIPYIILGQLQSYEVHLPPDHTEQQKIGAYFRSLDALISARRDEIAKLKDLKKALLDRMFV